MPGEGAARWRSRWRRRRSSCSATDSGWPPGACWWSRTPSPRVPDAGSRTRTLRTRRPGWARSPPQPSTLARGAGSGGVAFPAELRQLIRELVERVLDRLEALRDRAQAPRQAVDVVARRQVQIADRAGARLRGTLPRAERDLQRLVHPGVVDQDLGQLTQGALATRRNAIPYTVAAAFVHIVHARYRDRWAQAGF